jgi:hypothetical protein
MTAPAEQPPAPPPAEPVPVEEAPPGTPAATVNGWQVAAIAAAGVPAVDAVWRLLPSRVVLADLGPFTTRLVVALLARSVTLAVARARAAAGLAVADLESIRTGRVVAPRVLTAAVDELPRFTRAAETLVERAPDTGGPVGPLPDEDRAYLDELEDELGRLAEEQAADDAAELEELEAELRRLAAEEAAADAEEARQVAAEEQAARVAEEAEARELAEELAARDAADTAERAAEDAAEAKEEAREAAQRAEEDHRDAEALQKAEEDERAARRAAEEARVRRLAESEAARAVDAEVGTQLADGTAWAGWLRGIDRNACETCKAWHRGPGELPPVRPFTVPMKRHPGCNCVRVPITEEDARRTNRVRSDRPEPVAPRWRRARDRDDRPDDGDAADR